MNHAPIAALGKKTIQRRPHFAPPPRKGNGVPALPSPHNVSHNSREASWSAVAETPGASATPLSQALKFSSPRHTLRKRCPHGKDLRLAIPPPHSKTLRDHES